MAFAVAPPRPLSFTAGGWRPRPWATPPRFAVVACTRDGDPAQPTFRRLREQLLQLHAEADITQSKANSARVRLVRLTEAAENLKKRAANSVRMGRESEAVDLLMQKKKLTNALESIKERIEVLDKLSAKISEAISLKQNMLIQCALRPEMPDSGNFDDNMRVFSSKINGGADGTERVVFSKVTDMADGTDSSDSHPKSVENNAFEIRNEADANIAAHPEQREVQMADSFTYLTEHDPADGVTDRSAYDGLLEHIDLQLKSLEYETGQFMSSQLVEGMGNESQIDAKWHGLSDILKLIKETRERVASILDATSGE